ncbi:MAG: DUF2934 domain-containing protein [Chloracidobacterium sp.]|nr:DUF2934 domain-containing protein [Chloracidobacterium sp.]MDW8216395.1 hypothetical protein [Acidobacteriota bacterium]
MIDTQQVRQSLLQDRAVVDAIRRRAHQISLERGYSTPQHMADDWFRAENEILEKLVEEEIKRRQKMNAAISESAMAEESIPSVTLSPPDDQPAPAPTRKPVARRSKKATAPEVGAAAALSPTAEVADKPKRTRKAKTTEPTTAMPQKTAAAEAPPPASAKTKAMKSSKRKTP